MEGGDQAKESIERIIQSGIQVMGHLGLTPQSIYKFGSYTVRAKKAHEAEQLIMDTQMLQDIGCFGIVLEKIPAKLAKQASRSVNIPIIGIGAGSDVDGQVLVLHDMLGMNKEFSPRFLRRYAELDKIIHGAVNQYIIDVKSKNFPNDKEQY
jgi:3-methyl-2-oxobutanoate hydroxymethyltransferase